jgi:protein phosphatase
VANSDLRFAAEAASDIGRKRTSNEDALRFSVERGVFLVCDGMGGAAAGEIASALAADEVLRQLSERTGAVPLHDAVREAVRAANDLVFSRARLDHRLSGMGTTLVGLVAEGSRVLVFNIGDSRCYRLRHAAPDPTNPASNRLEQISLDHSLVAEQFRLGRMTLEEARHSRLRNVITRALGTESKIEADLFEVEAEAGDIFLLCSDGLTGEVTNQQIETLLAARLPLDQICAHLIEAANQAGGNDNITCLLVRAEE